MNQYNKKMKEHEGNKTSPGPSISDDESGTAGERGGTFFIGTPPGVQICEWWIFKLAVVSVFGMYKVLVCVNVDPATFLWLSHGGYSGTSLCIPYLLM